MASGLESSSPIRNNQSQQLPAAGETGAVTRRALRLFVLLVCWAVAGALFLAVFGKASKPLPTIKAIAWATGDKPAPFLLLALMAIELSLACVLAARWQPRLMLFGTAALFGAFAAWNGTASLLNAHAQCGCGVPNPLVGLLTPTQASLVINVVVMALCLAAGLVARRETTPTFTGGSHEVVT